jgi:hypothetical protein
MNTGKPGTFLALAYCHIHAVRQSSKTVAVS